LTTTGATTAKKKTATKKRAAITPKRSTPRKSPGGKARAKKPKTLGPLLPALPILWRFQTSTQAVGLWVNELVWVANDAGEVFALDKDGAVQRTLKLPRKSYCVFADEAWTYAGCVNGAVYDLTGRVPREMYRVTNRSAIGWIEGYRGNLCVSDHGGSVTVIDVEGNVRWRRQDRRATEGWVARADATGVLHGSTVGLRKYDWDGELTWALTDLGDVDEVRKATSGKFYRVLGDIKRLVE
jgi:outer membrane protein assembly factor BamB